MFWRAVVGFIFRSAKKIRFGSISPLKRKLIKFFDTANEHSRNLILNSSKKFVTMFARAEVFIPPNLPSIVNNRKNFYVLPSSVIFTAFGDIRDRKSSLKTWKKEKIHNYFIIYLIKFNTERSTARFGWRKHSANKQTRWKYARLNINFLYCFTDFGFRFVFFLPLSFSCLLRRWWRKSNFFYTLIQTQKGVKEKKEKIWNLNLFGIKNIYERT